MKTTFLLLTFLSLFFVNTSFVQQPPSGYQVVGTEPFWSLMITETKAEFDLMDSKKINFDSIKKMNFEGTSEGYGFGFQVSSKDNSGVILFRKCDNGCSDGMSEVKYTYEAFFIFNGKIYCGAANAVEK